MRDGGGNSIFCNAMPFDTLNFVLSLRGRCGGLYRKRRSILFEPVQDVSVSR